MKRALAFGSILILAACQAAPPKQVNRASVPGDDSALSTMERIAVAAQKCWFAAKDPAFRDMKMSPELASYAGKPRILAVPGKNIGGLPALVVEAQGNPARLSAYGPMMQGPDAARIAADIKRWAARDESCAASG
ncbi:MAG: hypothetical protein WAT70_04380 [Rhizobiaceae bacterium]